MAFKLVIVCKEYESGRVCYNGKRCPLHHSPANISYELQILMHSMKMDDLKTVFPGVYKLPTPNRLPIFKTITAKQFDGC